MAVKRPARRLAIALIVVLGILLLGLLSHVYMPSVVGRATFRNESGSRVTLEYSGSTPLEHGQLTLAPSDEHTDIVFRGDDLPAGGYDVRVLVRREGQVGEESYDFRVRTVQLLVIVDDTSARTEGDTWIADSAD
jgi:hypothetical protein